MDKQANDNVVHQDRFGEANSFAHEALDAGAQCQMFPFSLLGVVLAGYMSFGCQLPGLRPPMVSKEARDAKGL